MAHPLAIVLGDVHIGNNANTFWYQKSIHEQYLVTALNWIVDFESRQPGVIQEVVLLDDLIDTWTYPPVGAAALGSRHHRGQSNVLGPAGRWRPSSKPCPR